MPYEEAQFEHIEYKRGFKLDSKHFDDIRNVCIFLQLKNRLKTITYNNPPVNYGLGSLMNKDK